MESASTRVNETTIFIYRLRKESNNSMREREREKSIYIYIYHCEIFDVFEKKEREGKRNKGSQTNRLFS